jgi:ATP-dependent HslUV protease ATP-binding subunit HslU
VRILSEPENALTKQYIELFKTEKVTLSFTSGAIAEIARYAALANERMEDIGARA